MRGVLVVVFLGIVSAVASAAPRVRAESADQEVERLASEAMDAYRTAHFERAVTLLDRAYSIRPLPALLFNLAKTYDKMGETDLARQYYRRYLEAGEIDAKLAPRVRERLNVLDARARDKNGTLKNVPPNGQANQTPDGEIDSDAPLLMQPAQLTAEEIAQQTRAKLEKEQAREKEERDRLQAKVAAGRDIRRKATIGTGVAIALVGLGCIGGGGGYYVAASNKFDQFSASRDEKQKLQLKSDVQALGVNSTIMYGVGSGLAVVGAVLAIAGAVAYAPREPKETVSFTPWMTASSVGGMASWQF